MDIPANGTQPGTELQMCIRDRFDAATARECTFKTFDSYSFAPDGSKLLIATETTPIYRHSYTAVHLSLIHI